MQESYFSYLWSSLKLAGARFVHHPLEELGATVIAARNNLSINLPLSIFRFVYYSAWSFLPQIKKVAKDQIDTAQNGASNINWAGKVVVVTTAAVSGLPLYLAGPILNLSPETRVFLFIGWANMLIQLDNAEEKQLLNGFQHEGVSFWTTALGSSISVGSMALLAPRLRESAIPVGSIIGGSVTNICNKTVLIKKFGKRVYGMPTADFLKDIAYLITDGGKNAVIMMLDMTSMTALSVRFSKYKLIPEASTALQIIYSLWGIPMALSSGFNMATGRRMPSPPEENIPVINREANRSFLSSTSTTLFLLLWLLIFPRQITALITQNKSVQEISATLMRLIGSAEFLYTARQNQANSLRMGLNDNYVSVISSFISTTMFLMLCFMPFEQSPQRDSVNFLCCMGLGFLITSIRFAKKFSTLESFHRFFKNLKNCLRADPDNMEEMRLINH